MRKKIQQYSLPIADKQIAVSFLYDKSSTETFYSQGAVNYTGRLQIGSFLRSGLQFIAVEFNNSASPEEKSRAK